MCDIMTKMMMQFEYERVLERWLKWGMDWSSFNVLIINSLRIFFEFIHVPFHIVFLLLMRRNPFPVRVIIMKEFCLLCKDTFDSFWWLSEVVYRHSTTINFYIAPYTHNIDVQEMKISYIFFVQRQPVSNYDVPGRWLKEGRNISWTKTRVNNLLVNIDADYEFMRQMSTPKKTYKSRVSTYDTIWIYVSQ